MTESRWWTYLQRLMGADNAQTAAQRAGISSSNFSRWKKGANADPEFVLKIARAYHANVLEALVEAEFLTEAEAGLKEVNLSQQEVLEQIDGHELIEELKRRFAQMKFAEAAHEAGQAISGIGNVHPLTPRNQPSGIDARPDFEKMPARKSRKSGGETNVDE